MKSIGKKLIIISFIMAILTSVSVFSYLKSLKKPVVVEQKRTVLVAAEDIPARTLVSSKMIKEVEVPEDSIFDGYIEARSDIEGKYTKDIILKNEGFRKDRLLSKDGDELGFKIDDGHRAVSLNVSGASGIADLLQPGDYVDVTVFLGEKKDGQTLVHPDITKTILQNVKVLAVDKETARETTDKQEDNKVPTTFLVTLSVAFDDIEKLALAENIGSLKLALRPLDKEEDKKTQGATWENLIVDNSGDSADTSLQSGGNQPQGQNANGSTPAADKGKIIYYTVKPGDTLRSISSSFYGTPSKYTLIRDMNKIGDEDMIITGEVIKIPPLKE
ncbi:MAG: Flp pilus assembly protein CpaB [Bacillota bacterium]|nr:Flp pilus assembly protein CpaB [Bacillota bacterium]